MPICEQHSQINDALSPNRSCKKNSLSWAVPLDYSFSELFKIFAESQGIPLTELVFTFNGRVISQQDNPHTAGLCRNDEPNRIIVSRANVEVAAIEALDRLSEVVVAPVTSGAVDPKATGGDLRNLFRFDGMRLMQQMVFDFVGMAEVVSCAMVCRHWLALGCKHGVTWQLNQGSQVYKIVINCEASSHIICLRSYHFTVDINTAFRSFYILQVETNMQQYTHLLKQAFAQTRGTMHPHARSAILNVLSLHKDKWRNLERGRRVHLGGFMSKAARVGYLAVLQNRTESFQSQLEGIVLHRMEFFSLLKAKQQQLNEQKKHTDHTQSEQQVFASPQKLNIAPPPSTSPFKIVSATTAAQKQSAIALYRRYFGSDLHFIYPVVVGAATVGDLFDFSTCVTWIAQRQPKETEVKAKVSAPSSSSGA